MRGSEAVKEAERIVREAQRVKASHLLPVMDFDTPQLVQEDGTPYVPTMRARIGGWLRRLWQAGGRW